VTGKASGLKKFGTSSPYRFFLGRVLGIQPSLQKNKLAEQKLKGEAAAAIVVVYKLSDVSFGSILSLSVLC